MPFIVPSTPVSAPLFDATMQVLAHTFAGHDVVLLVSPKLPAGAVALGAPEVVGGATLPEDRMLGLLTGYAEQIAAMLKQRMDVPPPEPLDMPAPQPSAESSEHFIPESATLEVDASLGGTALGSTVVPGPYRADPDLLEEDIPLEPLGSDL